MQNGTVSGQTALDGTETAAVNGVLTSDGDVAAAATEEDAVVCISHHCRSPTHYMRAVVIVVCKITETFIREKFCAVSIRQ